VVIESLVIAPQWIGDAVMTEPLLRRLAARGERITVAAVPWVAPVYRAMPQVAEVLLLPFARGGVQWAARRAYAQGLRGRFAKAYIGPNSFKSALIPYLAGIPERIGYQGEMRIGVVNRRLPNPPKHSRPPMVAFYSALSGEAGVDKDRPALQVAPAAVEAVLAPRGLQTRGFMWWRPVPNTARPSAGPRCISPPWRPGWTSLYCCWAPPKTMRCAARLRRQSMRNAPGIAPTSQGAPAWMKRWR